MLATCLVFWTVHIRLFSGLQIAIQIQPFHCSTVINHKLFQEICRSCDSAWTSMAVPFLSHWMRLTHDSSQLTHFQLDHWYSRPSRELYIWLSANSNIASISSIYSACYKMHTYYLTGVYIWFNCFHPPANAETSFNLHFLPIHTFYHACMHSS